MKKITTLILLAVLTLGWTSCSKDDEKEDNVVKPKTKTELLTAHPWKLTGMTVNPAYQGVTDLYSSFTCYQDNSENYSSNNTFVQNEGADICNNGTATATGRWSFNSNETILQTEYDDNIPSSTYNLVELSENSLKYSGVYTVEGEEYTITYAFSPQ